MEKSFYFVLSLWNQCGFPDPATEMAGRLFMYHDLSMVVVVMVLLVVGWFLGIMLAGNFFFDGSLNRFTYKNELLETFWTIVPALFLIGLGYVSLKNLYDMEVGDYVEHILKVTGHQWYWEYRYEVNFSKEVCKEGYVGMVLKFFKLWVEEGVNAETVEVGSGEDESRVLDGSLLKSVLLESVASLFMKGDWFLNHESYIVPESELLGGSSVEFKFRNQWVDNSCLLVHSKKNEVLVSTADVMHSWGVAELGVKADAVPGRSNALSVEPVLSGVFFGNCYELCGEGHSQMPVVVMVMNYSDVVWFMKECIMKTDSVEEFFGKF